MATLSRHFRGTSHNGADPVEKHTPPRTDTNTGTATGVHHGPDRGSSSQRYQETASGPTDQEEKATEDDDFVNDTMTSITTFQVSPDLMEQTSFHNYTLHEDKYDPNAFAPNSNNYEFPNFPDPPPLAGNPLFDEKEAAFMSSFFDTVDQNTSFDHEFQDGLAQWTVPLDLRKGFDDVWSNQQNVTNGATSNNYGANAVFSMPHYEPATSEPNYAASPYPKTTQNVPIVHTQPQQYNPSAQNFLSHFQNPNHNPNEHLARTVFTHRNPHPPPSQCDPLFSGYPSVNIPAASPSALPSAAQTPNSTPKLNNYSFLKHEISSSESPPANLSLPPRHSIQRAPPSTYAPSSASSSSPQPNGKPPRKKRRENLSEQQKRINHITSEQKRRNLIQEGFNEIHSLVPTLRGQRERGDSKSTVLLKTVEYIRELREGNDRLRRMIKR